MGNANEHTMNERAKDDHSPRRSRRQVLAAAGGLGAAVVAGCLGSGDDRAPTGDSGGSETITTSEGMAGDSRVTTGNSATEGQTPMPGETTVASPVQGPEPTAASDTAWRSVEFSPVRRDETLTVDGFDRPVVLETFAVWCPRCTEQQQELQGLDDSVVKISVNVDPNEDADRVRTHADDNDFDWRYVVAPSEMVQSLVDAFGTAVTNAPSTPVIVACPGGGSSFFSGRQITDVPTIETAAGNC